MPRKQTALRKHAERTFNSLAPLFLAREPMGDRLYQRFTLALPDPHVVDDRNPKLPGNEHRGYALLIAAEMFESGDAP